MSSSYTWNSNDVGTAIYQCKQLSMLGTLYSKNWSKTKKNFFASLSKKTAEKKKTTAKAIAKHYVLTHQCKNRKKTMTIANLFELQTNGKIRNNLTVKV